MEIKIEVYNRHRSYIAGEVVQGRLIVQNEKPDKVKEITISLQGRGHVQWKAHRPDPRTDLPVAWRLQDKTSTVTCLALEKYVTITSVLAGTITLPEGTTYYPFRFVLPTNLPSSFNNHVGQVFYFLRAEVKGSSSIKSKDKLYFTVNGIFDLNLQPGATVAKKCTQVKGPNSWVGRRGKLNFVLRLPTRSGFVPGEAIDFKADITNGSNKKITGVKAYLQQVAHFHAQGATTKTKWQVCEVHGPVMGEGEHKIWEGNLLIPAVPPTKLGGGCKCIALEYFIHLELNMSGLSSSVSARLPVMIGTIPLRSTFGNFRSNPERMSGSAGKPTPSVSTTGFSDNPSESLEITEPEPAPVYSDYPDLPPPSYMEALDSEGLTFNPERNDADASEAGSDNPGLKQDGDDSIHPTFTSALIPTADEFVPNYITYNRRV